jgi:hypothetical protein
MTPVYEPWNEVRGAEIIAEHRSSSCHRLTD